MAAPVSNESPLQLDLRKNQGAERGKADEAPLAGQPNREENSPKTADDTVSLSQAGRQMSGEKPADGGVRTSEEARNMAAQLKEKLAANPGFAAAVHNASDVSRLATMLDNYA